VSLQIDTSTQPKCASITYKQAISVCSARNGHELIYRQLMLPSVEQLRQFIEDGIAKGYFEGQSRELDVQAELDDPKHELHRFPVFRITPQHFVAQFIAGVTDISGPRSSRSIKMRVAGGTFEIDTLCHETCHFYVSNTFRNMVTSRKDGGDFLGNARISQLLLEGFAEYFNREVMVAKADRFGPPAFDYPPSRRRNSWGKLRPRPRIRRNTTRDPVTTSVEVSRKIFDTAKVAIDGSVGVITALEFIQHHFSEMGHGDTPATQTYLSRRATTVLFASREAFAARAASCKSTSRNRMSSKVSCALNSSNPVCG
jgi:hypothetical protein